jgi:hypothetical protein
MAPVPAELAAEGLAHDHSLTQEVAPTYRPPAGEKCTSTGLSVVVENRPQRQ